MSKEVDVIEEKLDEQMPDQTKNQADKYDQEIADFTKELEGITDEKELGELLTKYDNLTGENTDKLKSTMYTLPENTNFRGTVYSKAKVGEYVADFLSSIEVNWQMTLPFFELITFWKNAGDVTEVSHEYYEATIQFLGEKVRYKGFENIKKIIVANQLFNAMHTEYINNLMYTYYLAGMHTAVQNRLAAVQALNTPGIVNEGPDGQ